MVPWVIGNLSLARCTFVQNELVHSLAEDLTPVNKVNNRNVNYLKILKTHRGPTTAHGPRVESPGIDTVWQQLHSFHIFVCYD